MGLSLVISVAAVVGPITAAFLLMRLPLRLRGWVGFALVALGAGSIALGWWSLRADAPPGGPPAWQWQSSGLALALFLAVLASMVTNRHPVRAQ